MRGLWICALGLVLTGCQLTAPKAPLCGCGAYFAKQPRPDWVDGDKITGSDYISSGVAQCTGLKGMDIKDADAAARASLSRLISAQVSSQFESEAKKFAGSVTQTQVKIQTQLSSSLLLNNSQVFSRWVDPNTCHVYSGVKVSQRDVEQAVAEAAEREASKWINQKIRVKASGEHAALLKREGAALLSQLGVARQVEQGEDLVMELTLADTKLMSAKHLQLTLHVVIGSAKVQVLWTKLVKGKGLSFAPKAQSLLLEAALGDALERLNKPLSRALSQTRNNES